MPTTANQKGETWLLGFTDACWLCLLAMLADASGHEAGTRIGLPRFMSNTAHQSYRGLSTHAACMRRKFHLSPTLDIIRVLLRQCVCKETKHQRNNKIPWDRKKTHRQWPDNARAAAKERSTHQPLAANSPQKPSRACRPRHPGWTCGPLHLKHYQP